MLIRIVIGLCILLLVIGAYGSCFTWSVPPTTLQRVFGCCMITGLGGIYGMVLWKKDQLFR